MHAIEWIAEQRIREAVETGKLDNLPGSGRPLRIDLDHHLPPELRLAYTILRNAGFVPLVIDLRRQIDRQIEELTDYLEVCVRYATAFREKIEGPDFAGDARRHGGIQRLKPGNAAATKGQSQTMRERYELFRKQACREVKARVSRINAAIAEQRKAWLRESARRQFAPGIDMSLVPLDERLVLSKFAELLSATDDRDSVASP